MVKRDESSRIAWGIFIVLAILWIAHVYAAYYPSGRVWGILHGLALPPLWRWAVWLVGLALIFPPVAGVLARTLRTSPMRLPESWFGGPSTRRILLFVWLFIPLFIVRSRAFIFGDGYRMLDRLAESGPSILFSTDILKETLDFGWHWLNHRLWAEPLGIPPAFTYGFLNSIAGVLLLLGLARLIRELAEQRERRLLLWSAVLSSGTLLLGFGYVESYTWAFAGVVWALVFAVRSVDQPKLWRSALIIWLIAVGFHLLALIFAPAFIWARWSRRNNRHIHPVWSIVILGVVLIGGALAAARIFQIQLFVFPPPGQSSPYLLWSPAHALDMLNNLLLIAPAFFPLFVGVLLAGKHIKPGRAWGIVFIAAISAWWASVVIDPSLGAARDWDLLSYFGPFLGLSMATLFLIRRPDVPRTTMGVLAFQLLGLCIFHTVPWVAAHQDAEDAVEMMDVVLVADPHLSIEYLAAARAVDFGQFLINDELQRYDLGTKYFLRRVTVVPTDPDAWWSLGSMYWYRGLPDSCYHAYRQSLRADSTNAVYWHNFGLLLLGQNYYGEAKRCFHKVLELEPDNWQVAWGLGEVYRREKKHDSAAIMFQQVALLEPDYWEAFLAAGMELMHDLKYPEALSQYNRALTLNPTEPSIYRRMLEVHLLGKDIAGVRNVLRNWRRAATPQTKDEILQWGRLIDSFAGTDVGDAGIARLFAGMGEWYASRKLEHVAYDCYYRAARLDTTIVSYRMQADTLRSAALRRLDETRR